MPLPGDQHRDTYASANPFADNRPKLSEYSAQEIATLQSRLEKQLGPEYISTRPGAGGGKVHYLAAEKVINLANEVFGFNGWSSAIQNVQIDFVDENAQSGKITLGLSCIVRVTIRDGTYHEDVGYGHIENCKGKAAAFEKAKKEAATDALKRALRNFGNVLGNCLYDKEYLQKVTKIKVAPSKWDADNLHRHADYAPIKRESIAEAEEKTDATRRQSSGQSSRSVGSAEFEEDFGGSLLNEDDFTHPDEVQLDDSKVTGIESPAPRAVNEPQQGTDRHDVPRNNSTSNIQPPNIQQMGQIQAPQARQKAQPVQRLSNNVGHAQPHRPPPPPQGMPQRVQHTTGPQQRQNQQNIAPPPPPQQHVPAVLPSEPMKVRSNPSSGASAAESPSQAPCLVQSIDGQQLDTNGLPMPCVPPAGIPEGFVTGRSVDLLNQPGNTRPPNAAIAFNPHADSPSIRRTSGVNPGKSAPVTRQALNGTVLHAPQSVGTTSSGGHGINGVATSIRTNYINPAADPTRRIGAPVVPGTGGIQTRSQYRPPSAVGSKRPVLADVSNTNGLAQMDGASDSKKQKVESVGAVEGPHPKGNGRGEAATTLDTTAAAL
ncbi:hypothetical protein M433DRAFT_146592 [Acidomyces richmondensis BFW]|nr:MAG: hypothetical protein FE78DRAFT_74634 [Acidomyces sp. 'richmondensis']KYG42645.1 hypothetical protein M433DRAFT_146592 [Acidomyces richmondensis BFW]